MTTAEHANTLPDGTLGCNPTWKCAAKGDNSEALLINQFHTRKGSACGYTVPQWCDYQE